MSLSEPTDALFERARRTSPAAVARAHKVKLNRRGDKARGACPLCGGGAASEAFMADEKGPIWHCFACGETGDSVALEMALGGHDSRVAAARVLAGEDDRVSVPRTFPERPPADAPERAVVESAEVAALIIRRIQPAKGTIVEAWLAARGISPAGIRAAIDRIGFLPRCPVSAWPVEGGADSVRHAPAMIAPLRTAPDAEACGVHVTYLSTNGRAKMVLLRRDGSRMAARKMYGRARGAGCFLSSMAGSAPLVVGEGIETVLSYGEALPGARMLAVLSLDNLQGRALRDREGVVPLWALRGDPEAGPMTLADAGAVHVLVDADMSPVQMRVQVERRGRRERVRIDGLKRSEICAALAVQAWRRAGARPVIAVRAPACMDCNNLARCGG